MADDAGDDSADRPIYPYHPLSDCNGADGHWPHLAPNHQQALHELKTLLAERGYDLARWALGEPQELMLLRFLRAKKFVVRAAFEMLSKDLEWCGGGGARVASRARRESVARALVERESERGSARARRASARDAPRALRCREPDLSAL